MFKIGDVLLYEAPAFTLQNVFPRLVRLVTGNKVTHVALYLGLTGEGHLILEALSSGVKIKSFKTAEELKIRKDGFLLHGVSRLSVLNDSHYEAILWASAKYNNHKYGFLTAFNLFLQHGKTLVFPKKAWTSWVKTTNGYICSEVTQLVLEDLIRFNRLSFTFPKKACVTEPDDYLVDFWDVTIIK